MIRSLLAGALAGGVATLAMSPLMAPRLTRTVSRAVPGVAPLEEFPPRRVVQEAQERVPEVDPLSDESEDVATWLSHIGFGVAMGALYGVAVRQAPPGSGVATGTLFGLGVWAVSYLGWMPAFGVSTGTASGHPGQLPFPFAAHLVYGFTTGMIHDRLR